ncbi:MAG: SusD/RagB family nutrient-binding outer membrane lipoprotein [Chitinophagaceae bacterium]
MRRILIHISLAAALVSCLISCKKKLEEFYYNPDQTTQASIEKFFTEMLDNDRVRPSYWEIRTFTVLQTGIYSQSVAYLNTNPVYQQNPSYTQDRWNDFYRPGGSGGGVMAHYRSIETAYNLMGVQQQTEARIFLEAAKVVLMDQAAQMVDCWGDMPFSEAGSINTSGEIKMAKFDNAAAIYSNILDGLKMASYYFSHAQHSTTTQIVFSKQDILLNGDLEKWQRYANSVRLRLLIRMSFLDEPFAKSEVMTMLNNPFLYPLIDGVAGYIPKETDVLLQPLTNYTGDLHNAFAELTNYSAPDYLLNDVMKPADDPRIPVMFDKYGRTVSDVFTPNTDYNGLPVNMPLEQQQIMLGNYAILDSATFLYNNKLPGIVITASEVNFLKAEAFERWGGGDAKTYYDMAVKQSVAFYYYLNSLNTVTRDPLPTPSETVVESFLQNSRVKYFGTGEEKLKKIWVQKWLHFGFLQSVQSWAEYRRTKYPQLSFYVSTLPGFELPPSRLLYPASETTYNSNYLLIKDKDTRSRKIFWDVK